MSTFYSIFADLIAIFHGLLFGYMATTPFFILWAIFKYPQLNIRDIAPWIAIASIMLINNVHKAECQITTAENNLKELSEHQYNGGTFVEHHLYKAGLELETFYVCATISTLFFGTLAIKKAIKLKKSNK